MERIVINVDNDIAKKWRLSSQKSKEEISRKIQIRLAKELMGNSKEEFKRFLDEVGSTMKQRGLTEEDLQEILEEDE